MKKFEFTGLENQLTVASGEIYAKRLLVVQTDGIGLCGIIASAPVNKEVQYVSAYGIGSLTFAQPLTQGEAGLVLYEDDVASCEPPLVQSGVVLPDAYINESYAASFIVSGTTPMTLGSIVVPDGLSAGISGSMVSISGTPTTLETNATVGFTINNGCGSASFSDTINVLERNNVWRFLDVMGFGSFTITVNGVLTISDTNTSNGSFTANVGDVIAIRVQTNPVRQATITITGAYNNSTTDVFIVDDTFTVTAGNYDIYMESE